MTRTFHIAFFLEGVDTPASRFRCEQYFPHFERAGIKCTPFFGYGVRYNGLHKRRIAPLYKLACRLKRGLNTITASGFDLLFFQRSSLPFSAFPEQIRQAAGARTIFDFDDLLDVGPTGGPSSLRAHTCRASIRGATHVIAGNRYLAHVANAPSKPTVIPTVVDTSQYRPPVVRPASGPVTIGWMGTSGNFNSLRTALPSVMEVLKHRPTARLRIVSNAPVPELAGLRQVEQIPWSRAR